jgi:hypothetical protein
MPIKGLRRYQLLVFGAVLLSQHHHLVGIGIKALVHTVGFVTCDHVSAG